jgi:hypothetical protein
MESYPIPSSQLWCLSISFHQVKIFISAWNNLIYLLMATLSNWTATKLIDTNDASFYFRLGLKIIGYIKCIKSMHI